jgi:MFS family permease
VSNEEARVQRSLVISVVEGSLNAVMLGAAESYLGALAVELGHGPLNQAWLATIPLACASISQLGSGPLARLWGRKRVTVAAAIGQGLAMGGLALIALGGYRGLGVFLLAKCAFFIAGGVLTPTWNSWITALTANVSREKYFGRRSAINQLCVLFAFLGAGFYLQSSHGNLTTFATLCGVGLVARLASGFALGLQVDPPDEANQLGSLSAWARCVGAARQSKFRVATYMAFLMFGATVSTPFFTPYMLRELNMDYGTFASMSATSLASKALFFRVSHRFAARMGLTKLLVAAGIGVALVPIFWAVSARLEWLLWVHILSGAAWAALEYSSFQLLIGDTPAEYRTEFFSLSNSLSGVLQVIGSLIGGTLLREQVLSYTQIFLLSGTLRAVPLALLFSELPRLRIPRRLWRLPTRPMAVRPSAGTVDRPILPAAEDED